MNDLFTLFIIPLFPTGDHIQILVILQYSEWFTFISLFTYLTQPYVYLKILNALDYSLSFTLAVKPFFRFSHGPENFNYFYAPYSRLFWKPGEKNTFFSRYGWLFQQIAERCSAHPSFEEFLQKQTLLKYAQSSYSSFNKYRYSSTYDHLFKDGLKLQQC